MKQTSAAVLALLLANTSAHRISKLEIHRDQLLDIGVRFATGMNGDEDLGQDITMKGEKFHYNQQMVQLPLCDGSNGVVGLDCLSTGGYPKKTAGRPWAPMNDAYPPGHPRYASRVQMRDADDSAGSDAGQRDNQTEEDQMEAEPVLPTCNGSNGVAGVDCLKPKPAKKKGSLAQQDGDASDAGQRDNQTEEDQMEAEPALPECNGSNGKKGIDCLARKKKPLCKANVMPKLQPGEEEPCRLLDKKCSEHPGLVPGEECFKDQSNSGLVQLESHHKHKHHHRHHHKHRDADDSAGSDAGQRDNQTEEDQMEAEPVLPTCNGSNGVAGVDCLKPKAPKKKGLIQVSGDDKEEAFKYPPSNGFDLPELPECTGMNGPDAGGRKVQCRQIGRFTTTGNWFVQTEGEDGKDDKDTKPDYKKLTSGTPQLPECTGMNGDRKGPGTDCRQIGRYNGPWPVTDDVQIKAIGDIQNLSQLPTCDQWITTNCQPVCTRDLTTGCTEERTPEPPKRDRFEGKWTHKPGQTTIQPRILPRDGVTNNYQH